MTQETVDKLIEYRNRNRLIYARSYNGLENQIVTLYVGCDGTYYVENGGRTINQFTQPAIAIDAYNKLIHPQHRLK